MLQIRNDNSNPLMQHRGNYHKMRTNNTTSMVSTNDLHYIHNLYKQKTFDTSNNTHIYHLCNGVSGCNPRELLLVVIITSNSTENPKRLRKFPIIKAVQESCLSRAAARVGA